MSEWVLYWLHDERCICLQQHGYVGISGEFMTRLAVHQRNKRFPPNFEWSIIFTGSKAECLALEHTLRPASGIGWNRAQGGKPVIEFTNDVRAAMSDAAKKRRTPGQRAAAQAAAQEARRDGEWNRKLREASTGKTRSEAARAKQSAATKGMPKSAETRLAMSEAAKLRYTRAAERERMSDAVKASKAHAIYVQRRFQKECANPTSEEES